MNSSQPPPLSPLSAWDYFYDDLSLTLTPRERSPEFLDPLPPPPDWDVGSRRTLPAIEVFGRRPRPSDTLPPPPPPDLDVGRRRLPAFEILGRRPRPSDMLRSPPPPDLDVGRRTLAALEELGRRPRPSFGSSSLLQVFDFQVFPPPPRPNFTSRWDQEVAEREVSRLNRNEQKKALDMLKKVIYNPAPKMISRRLNLYYREDNRHDFLEKEKQRSDEGKSCAICLEEFKPKEEVTVTPCGHMYHEECVVPWLMSKGRCPVCRALLYE